MLEIIDSPSRYVQSTSRTEMKRHFKDFKHRFTTGSEMAELLHGAGRVIEHHGSLGKCFAHGLVKKDKRVCFKSNNNIGFFIRQGSGQGEE